MGAFDWLFPSGGDTPSRIAQPGWLMNVFGNGKPATPPPTPEPPLPPLQVPDLGRLQIPGLTSRGPQPPQSFNMPPMQPYPQPSPIPNPPPTEEPDDFDASKARDFLRQAEPRPPKIGGSYTSDVLGGLARGVADVNPASPGSFGRALAAWGGGGAQGRSDAIQRGENQQQQYSKEMSAWHTAQANQEMTIAKADADVKNAQREVAQANANMIWKTEVENLKRQDEYKLKKFGLEQPDVKVTANGVAVTDPVSGKVEVHDTRPYIEKAQNIGQVLKGLPGGGPQTDLLAMQVLLRDEPGQPPRSAAVKIATAKQYLINQVINNDQGQAVFGKLWEAAYKTASAEMEKDPVYNAMRLSPTKSEEYVNAVRKRAAALVLPEAMHDDKWVYELAKQNNVIAQSMTGSLK